MAKFMKNGLLLMVIPLMFFSCQKDEVNITSEAIIPTENIDQRGRIGDNVHPMVPIGIKKVDMLDRLVTMATLNRTLPNILASSFHDQLEAIKNKLPLQTNEAVSMAQMLLVDLESNFNLGKLTNGDYASLYDGTRDLIKLFTNKMIVVDNRDLEVYTWVKLADGKKWMSEDMNYNMPSSRFYNDDPIHSLKFGQLYNWTAANEVCPEGWHLPSRAEWLDMLGHYGGTFDTDAYRSLVAPEYEGNGSSGFNGTMGGIKNSDQNFFSFINDRGHYWSSTEGDAIGAHSYFFYRFRKIIWPWIGHKDGMQSCRCVED